MSTKKYYAVTMVRGHQGTKVNEGLITFYYKAENLFQAINRAKKQPGVKHSRCPESARECTREEYEENIKISAYERAGVK